MKNTLLFSSLIVLLVSCSKDRRVIGKLDGTWNVDSVHVQYVKNKKVIFGSTAYYFLDTSKSYTFTNCGFINFDKKHGANNDYRMGNLEINIPKLPNSTDTIINRPMHDKQGFQFFVDQLPNVKNHSKLGIVGDTTNTYRYGTFANKNFEKNQIKLSYSIDSLKPATVKYRKGMFEMFISKQ